MINAFLDRLYAAARGGDAHSSAIPARVLVGLALQRVPEMIRGALKSRFYGRSGSPHLLGARARITRPSQLRVGRWVTIGRFVRLDAFSSEGIRLADRVTVGEGSHLLASGVARQPGTGITVGAHTAIGLRNVIMGQGGVSIGRDCLLGPNVTIVSENHVFSTPSSPIRTQGGERAPVMIGDDCWLGAGATVLAGVTVGDGAVVAAGAVVTADVEPYAIVAGVPARHVGSRRGTVA